MDEVVVETRYGTIQGTQEGPLQVFRGIPFAKPPIGPLRFRPPEPLEPWSGIRDATAFGPSPMQAPNPFIHIASTSEDCLYLNVWTPRADDARRPVMVYIYGGRFISGSASEPQYSGSAFAQDGDLVVVTLNYRLGALGFLYLGDLLGEDYAASGNCGLLDIIAALRWVREHIADFGGDPSQVTIMGQSSGAMCVATLLAMPAARGLFARALLESGAGQTARDTKTATRITGRLLSVLKGVPNEARTVLDLPAEEMIAAQSKLLAGALLQHDFGPVVDGHALPQFPLDAIHDGSAAQVPLLIGTNREESKIFMAMDAHMAHPDESVLKELFGVNSAAVMAAYTAVSRHKAPEDAWLEVLTDYQYRIAAVHLAEEHARRGVPVWMYRFDWSAGPLGAFHSLELPFAWQNLGNEEFQKIFQVSFSAKDQLLAGWMHAAWIAFLRTGNPNVPALPSWLQYTGAQRATMLFDTACHVAQMPPVQEAPGFQVKGFSEDER